MRRGHLDDSIGFPAEQARNGRCCAARRSCVMFLHTGTTTMTAVSVRELKSNPSAALRDARRAPVVVLKRNHPEAVLVHLSDDSLLGEPGVRLAIATALYRSESLSLGRAAEISGISIAEFMRHVSGLGIPVIRGLCPHAAGRGGSLRRVERTLVIADASPLIGLASAGAFDLLRRLFGQITVTTVVRDEVCAGGRRWGAAEVTGAIKAGWILVEEVDVEDAPTGKLGRGEASVLALARDRRDWCLLLMDDSSGESASATFGHRRHGGCWDPRGRETSRADCRNPSTSETSRRDSVPPVRPSCRGRAGRSRREPTRAVDTETRLMRPAALPERGQHVPPRPLREPPARGSGGGRDRGRSGHERSRRRSRPAGAPKPAAPGEWRRRPSAVHFTSPTSSRSPSTRTRDEVHLGLVAPPVALRRLPGAEGPERSIGPGGGWARPSGTVPPTPGTRAPDGRASSTRAVFPEALRRATRGGARPPGTRAAERDPRSGRGCVFRNEEDFRRESRGGANASRKASRAAPKGWKRVSPGAPRFR